MGLLLLCLLCAWGSGYQRVRAAQEAVAVALADEASRIAQLRASLASIEAGAQPIPVQAYRDPGNALAVGRGAGAAVLHLPVAPLAAMAVGLSDLHPPSFRVDAGSKDRFLFVDDLVNPAHLLSGPFDVAFVVVYLLPLMLMALSYDILSAEREQGTWALTVASSASPPYRILLAKLACWRRPKTEPLLKVVPIEN